MNKDKKINDYISITNNFLTEKDFVSLQDVIIHRDFPWHFSPFAVVEAEEKSSPGIFYHIMYENNNPMASTISDPHFGIPFKPLHEPLNIAVLLRIRINLNHRLPEPFVSEFHYDSPVFDDDIASPWTTSILYMNTNNGYTEFEDGTKTESVANRLLTFPLNTKHRICTQTDEQTRYVINLNYLKRKKAHGENK